jgi:hypothetical protein
MIRSRRILEQFGRYVLGVALTVLSWTVMLAGSTNVWGGLVTLEAEVLEGSDALQVPGRQAGPVRYAMVHHAHQQDRSALSEWLRSHESAVVTFSTKDGQSHQGVLRRLKHCFGRGLLIYADSVSLQEKDVVRLELPQEKERK